MKPIFIMLGMYIFQRLPKEKKTIIVCNLLRFSENSIDWENPADVAEIDERITEIGLDPKKFAAILKFASSL
jgi:hypothetical protein